MAIGFVSLVVGEIILETEVRKVKRVATRRSLFWEQPKENQSTR
jgi:hypothetical protein